jgi:AbrB family looped-hinge helix DNA binding protein
MRNTVEVNIDSAGRVVIPKAIRDQIGIVPGMALRITVEEGKIEIEPVTRKVRIVQRGPLRVAVPVEEGPPLTDEAVERVRREFHQRDE